MSLGKGLGALISSTGSQKSKNSISADEQKVWHIPLSKIVADPSQPRKHFDPEHLQELADSIKEHGVLQPILVTEKPDGGYEIIAGERRYRATQIAKIPTIPALVKELDKKNRLEISLIENIQRENLNPLEEAFAYLRLIDEFNLTQEEVAKKVGKSRPVIANTIRLLNLIEEAKTALVEGKISTSQAKSLLSLKNEVDQKEMLSSMLGQKMTVRDLERKVRDKTGINKRRDPNVSFLESELRQELNTKVEISKSGDKGRVVIYFNSEEELTDLVKKIKE